MSSKYQIIVFICNRNKLHETSCVLFYQILREQRHGKLVCTFSLVRHHFSLLIFLWRPRPTSVNPLAVRLVFLSIQAPQPLFLRILHQHSHEEPVNKRQDEKPGIADNQQHACTQDHESRIDRMANPRVYSRCRQIIFLDMIINSCYNKRPVPT